MHLPVFRGKGQVSMIDFNVERFNAVFIPDDPARLCRAEPHATEKNPGDGCGIICA